MDFCLKAHQKRAAIANDIQSPGDSKAEELMRVIKN